MSELQIDETHDSAKVSDLLALVAAAINNHGIGILIVMSSMRRTGWTFIWCV
jgi:hypothetical protein